jgi:hypothetical protein
MGKQTVTVEEFIELCKPCWDDDMIRRIAGGKKEEWTAADALRLEGPPEDLVWAALHVMAMTGRSKEAAQFARWCAEEALERAEEAASDAAGGAGQLLRERVGAMRRLLSGGASMEEAAKEAREAAWKARQALEAPLAAHAAADAAARTVKAAAWAAAQAA